MLKSKCLVGISDDLAVRFRLSEVDDLISISTSRSRVRHSSRSTSPVLFTKIQLKKEMDLFIKRYVYLD